MGEALYLHERPFQGARSSRVASRHWHIATKEPENSGRPAGARPRRGRHLAWAGIPLSGLLSGVVPVLREELAVPTPTNRGPGRTWKQAPALAVVPAPRTEQAVRIGYARTSTADQELTSHCRC